MIVMARPLPSEAAPVPIQYSLDSTFSTIYYDLDELEDAIIATATNSSGPPLIFLELAEPISSLIPLLVQFPLRKLFIGDGLMRQQVTTQ